ncbi:DsrE family protein [Candidatus Nitrosacidococcus tergens]|uniref:Uncharacterized protein n=1 Tax=Candidatus Nitrosacidococcus tergens TaxID=553981 RepID=A0A7G1Q9W3_9GAMM|nr:DsrE family protein [Candidatus Nitrosacidococcus tergens]CAB1276267.1 conserved exported protein of unknown function [Candidatus Nitrosacidococcus tergens]
MNHKLSIALLCLLFTYQNAIAEDSVWQTPAIEGVGKIHPLPHATHQPSKNQTYKVVFWLTKGSDDPKKMNFALDSVARAINLYASAGVSSNQLKFTVVVSGSTTDAVLNDTHYKEKYGVDNPNSPLIKKLIEAGVELLACGQAVATHGYQNNWLNPQVKVALSAMTTSIELQQQGYALVTF